MKNLFKKILPFVILLCIPAVALAQLNTHQGGTGVVDISAGSIPFGSVPNIRVGTSSAFQFSNSLSKLTVTNGSSTAWTSTNLYSTNASTTNLTISGLGGSAGQCLTINSSGLVSTTGCSTGGSGNVATSTHEVSGQVATFTSNSATPATIGGSTLFTFVSPLLSVSQASTSQLSVFNTAYFGGTATDTINSVGDLLVVGSTSLRNFTGINATTTNATSTAFNVTNQLSTTNLFVSGSSSLQSVTATNSTTTNATTTNLMVSGQARFGTLSNALVISGSTGIISSYAGSSCGANTYTTSVSATGVLTCAQVSLTAGVTGILPVANGGTNNSATPSSMLTAYNDAGTTIQATSTPAVAAIVATSTNATSTFAGGVGVGTTSPVSKFTVAGGAITNAEYTIATSSTTNIDWRQSSNQIMKLGTGAVTVTFSGDIQAGQTLLLTTCAPDSGTMGTITWPNGGTIIWSNETQPTQTTAAGKCDIYSFKRTIATSTPKDFGAQTPAF